MAHEERLDLRIEHNKACAGQLGFYAATLFHMDRGERFIAATPVELGQYDPSYDDSVQLLEQARQQAEKRRHRSIPTEEVIALNAARVCVRKRHDDAPNISDPSGRRIERAAGLVIAQAPLANVRIRPLDASETRALKENHGVGHARRHEFYLPDLQIVALPITRQEARDYMVIDAVRAAASAKTLSQKPHVVLHRRGTADILEQIVTLDELQ
jgi:hypothetical protein